MLRAAYEKAVKDPELLAEAKKLRIDVAPARGEELQAKAKEVMSQPPEVTPPLPRLAPRKPASHKGDFGRAILIGGSAGMSGAIAAYTRWC